jgi:uncharacterized protein (TIGR02099 family)
MPAPRAILRAPRAVTLALVRFLRTVVVVGFATFALALLVLRFVVLPQVESYRGTLASLLARQLGQPVEIAVLSTGWDGWNPKLVVEGFRVLDKARASPTPLLSLPKLEMIVSWTSVPLLELRLKELIVDGPRLAIRRDRSGILRIAGLEFDPEQATDELPITDWILRQRRIAIRDALIVWDDDLRNAPQLVLDRVQFRLESRFGHHRFGLKGTPPNDLAAPLDIRGDVELDSFRDWQNAKGKLFVRLDYADVAAWREWLPLPGQLASGTGAMRVWVDFARQEPREIVADVELADVKATLGANLPEIELKHLSGRFGTRKIGPQREIFAQALAFTTQGGEKLDPTNFQVAWREGRDERMESGRIEFERMQIAPLVALSAHLPLSDRLRADLARFAPRGTLSQGRLRWVGTAAAPTSYVASTEFSHLGLLAQDSFPGVTGLDGKVEATLDGGEIRIAGNNVTLDLPRVLEAPLAFDSLQSLVKWERREGATRVKLEQLEISNADMSGGASGTYRTLPSGPGEIEIVAHASRADARQIHRYLPRAIGETTGQWLATALVGGTAVDSRLKVSGNLADFPFARGKGGKLTFTTKAKGVTLAHTDGWPAIEAIDADVRIEGSRLVVDAARGRVYGVDIGKTRVEIPDMGLHPAMLRVDGEAAGPITEFMRYLNHSPLASKIGPLAKGAEAVGDGRLELKMGLPLGRPADVKVVGDFTFAESQVRIPSVPPLTKVSGKVSFSEQDVRARDVAAEVLGSPVRLSLTTIAGQTRVTGTGTFGLASLQREYTNAYLGRVSGSLDWAMNVNVLGSGGLAWIFESNLKGAAIDLPPPIGKTAADEIPLRVEGRDETGPPGTDFILASYGRIAQFAAHRSQLPDGGAKIDRALLSLGRSTERADASRAEQPGLWIRGELPTLNVDDWIALLPKGPANESGRPSSALALAGADLDVHQFDAMGARFADLKLRMRETPQGWSFDLDSPQIAGIATWSSPGPAAPNGRVMARLSRIALPGRGNPATWQSAEAKEAAADSQDAQSNHWPEIDLAADAFYSKERNLGKLEFVAKPQGADWKVDKLILANDAGRLEANGAWRVAARTQQTKLDVLLDAPDSGAFLARYGYAEGVKGAATHIEGQVAWAGAPHEFEFGSLNGSFGIRVGPGRFTKLEPGPGKLLGVLSLQALPRRVTLDYSDVFTEGFAFDEITGSVRIASGVMSTSDLRLVGPAAKVDISGETDLAKETQRLVVRVQPALSSIVSSGAALLFLTNPLVGAVVGAGSLFAQTILQDPVEKMFRYEYTITGGWSDPVIVKGSGGTSTAPGVVALPRSAGDR